MKIIMSIFFATLLYATHVQAQTCHLARIIEADGDTIPFSRNEKNHITSLGKNTTVKTNADGFITEFVHDDASSNSYSRSTYKYDGSNNLIEYEQFAGSSTKAESITRFKYNSFGQLIEAQSAVAVGANYFYGYRTFTYANTTTKNPSVIKNYSGDANGKTGEADETVTLTYDDKKTIGYPNPLDDFNPFVTHNVISATVVEVGQKPKTETFAYQYNAEGYPISKTEKENGKAYITHYAYSCK